MSAGANEGQTSQSTHISGACPLKWLSLLLGWMLSEAWCYMDFLPSFKSLQVIYWLWGLSSTLTQHMDTYAELAFDSLTSALPLSHLQTH